jgi:hypothetical protein
VGPLSRDRRASVAVLAAGLLTITCVGLAAWAIRAHHRADRATGDLEAARAEAARHREAARLAASSEEEARARAAVADSRRLAALSETERAGRPDRPLLLAVEAIHRGDTLEARGSLLDVLLTRPSVTAFYHRARGLVLSAAFSPDGKTLAAGLEAVDVDVCAGVALWDMEGRHRLFEQPLAVAGDRVTSVVFGSRMLAAGVDDGVVL